MWKGSNHPSIMVVDDTPANLKLLEQMLGGQNYRILAFPQGAMALAAASVNAPDLILLDINMPEMDGFEVCRRLKADQKLKDIPVLFISALSETKDKIKAFSVGGVDYVTKPFQFEEVRARVKTHLHLRCMQHELEWHNHQLEDLIREKVNEISNSQLATIVALSKLAEYRDDDTGQHINRTRIYCRLLAEKLKDIPRFSRLISETFIENIYSAAPLHDIGKVSIADEILLKPGKLTPEEFEIMKTHTTVGAMTLESVRAMYPNNSFINMGISLTRSHHEKWDGSGYPDGLVGEDIPLSARIIALADVYDALRSKRPYKEAFSYEKTREIIQKGAGKHFDPDIQNAFASIESKFNEIHTLLRDDGIER